MLTNKDIIEALENVGYSIDEIAMHSKISEDTLRDIKNGKDINDEKIEEYLNNFFRKNLSEVTIEQLSNNNYRNTHLIYTPNGFKKVLDYKTIDLQHCYKISLETFETVVGDKVQYQVGDKWVTVDKLKIGDKIKVFDEEQEVKNITEVGDFNCCSITVEGNEFYLDGVLSK